jgi:hypothetical protein
VLRLPDYTDHSLKAGQRGPTLLADFHLREKINHFDHFDHERIPRASCTRVAQPLIGFAIFPPGSWPLPTPQRHEE